MPSPGKGKKKPPACAWWEEQRIAEGQGARWRIGPLALAVQHMPGEWRLAWQSHDDVEANDVEVGRPEPAEAVEMAGKLLRVVADRIAGRLRVEPRLADRDVVARPETPFRLLPGSEISLYVSTPPWIALIFDGAEEQAVEMPVHRLSDTWFGPPTAAGQLCYSIRTRARLSTKDIPLECARVLTRVRIKNRAAESLSLERLSLPMPSLSLYADAAGYLWTQRVEAESDREGKTVRVDIGQGPPAEAAGAEALAGARRAAHKSVLVRALDGLFL